MGDIELHVEQLARKRHEHGLPDQRDDEGQDQPVFQNIVPPATFAQMADQGGQKKYRKGCVFGPVQRNFGVVGTRQGRKGEKGETAQRGEGGEHIDGSLIEPPFVAGPVFAPPHKCAGQEKHRQEQTRGKPAPRN